MVLITLRCIGIHTEALTFAVIVVVIHAAEPLVRTLDTEVVTRVESQFALSGTGLQQALRHRDSGRNAVLLLLLHCHRFPLLYIS